VGPSQAFNPMTTRKPCKSSKSSFCPTRLHRLSHNHWLHRARSRSSYQANLIRESEAKKGITKLMLLHVCAKIKFKESTVSDMTFATPSNGMEVILSHPQAFCPTSLVNLICQTLLMTKEQDHLSIRSKYISIQMVGKTLTTNMLSGNFATDRVTTLNNEVNFINPLAFLPQRNACMVKQMHMCHMIAKTEKSMDVLDVHKSKTKTFIT
jgi:hypothetical protein